MEPENTTPPEPNKPFGPAAEASQPTPPAVPQSSAPTTLPASADGGANDGPAAGPLPPTPEGQSSNSADQPLPSQPTQLTNPAVQPVSEGINQPTAMPTPVSTKGPRNTSLPAVILAGVVIVFLVVLAIYAFTKMK